MTDNERDAQTIRNGLGLPHALYGRDGSKVAHSLGTLPDCPVCEADQALSRLVAALSAATTERDGACEWPRGACAHWNGEYTGLGERLHTAEQRAEALAAQLQQAREALEAIAHGFDDPSSPGYQAGFVKQREIARAALAAAAPATTLNEPDGKSGTMADARHERLPSGSLSAAAAPATTLNEPEGDREAGEAAARAEACVGDDPVNIQRQEPQGESTTQRESDSGAPARSPDAPPSVGPGSLSAAAAAVPNETEQT